ncbi:MAG TPA: prolyl oligopeptidase family serine peptidase [Acidimicrobiales bacterium]|nr:prolyl oligopeptidase family serine peptidase [Acidimicrobiales bacterium]
MTTTDSFPRQSARTQRFTLGAPRDLSVADDGRLVAFLRSGGPEDPVTALWVLDLPDGTERCVADPAALHADDSDLPEAERARRERARESAAGITAYSTDAEHRVAVAALAGQLVAADLRAGTARLLDVPGPVVDPRVDPTGRRVSWVRDRALWVAELDDATSARPLASEDDPQVTWGLAEFIAAEEMGRHRGHWWSPDGTALLVARVDESAVARWWIADPARPDQPPTEVAYPAAGTADASVTAWLVALDGSRTEVRWDREALPYLAAASWDRHGPLVALHPRDQRALEVRAVDPVTGETTVLWEDHDDVWVERAPGTPARLDDGRLVVAADRDGTRRLVVDGEPVTPTDLHVRAVSHVGASIVFTANPVDDATVLDVWRWTPAAGGEPLERLAPRPDQAPGVHGAAAGGDVVVLRRSSLETWGATVTVHRLDDERTELASVRSLAAAPARRPEVRIAHVGPRRLATALLLPADAPEDRRLPVLLDPYGGPHAQRVVAAQAAYGTSQWFADQGYAVVVVDGRGTPGRGSDWERAVRFDLATPVLEDQLDALDALAAEEPRLDLDRVAIRGWSFGGYLAALAVLRRPDRVHAAIAGAPVTEWRLYDTFYTERYLGHPDEHPDAYDRSSLLPLADRLERPLLLVHGLADDNVVAAHTLQLSARLLGAGRPHEVLPLTGVTHMASQEDVAENLLLLQLDFLRRTIG